MSLTRSQALLRPVSADLILPEFDNDLSPQEIEIWPSLLRVKEYFQLKSKTDHSDHTSTHRLAVGCGRVLVTSLFHFRIYSVQDRHTMNTIRDLFRMVLKNATGPFSIKSLTIF